MNKKTLGRITALSIAALTAVPTFGIAASADIVEGNNIKIESTVWKVEVYNSSGAYLRTEYYKNEATATAAANNSGSMDPSSGVSSIITRPSKANTSDVFVSTGTRFDIDENGKIVVNSNGQYIYNGTASGSSGSSTGSGSAYYIGIYNQATDYYYESTATGYKYPNAQAFRADPANSGLSLPAAIPISGQKYNSDNRYFNYTTGQYDHSPNPGLNVLSSGYNGSSGIYGQYVIPANYTYASNTSYYSPETATWYPNLEALRAAVGYNTTNYTTKTPTTAYSSTNHYFNPVTGNYVSSTYGYTYAVSVSAGSATTGRYTVYYSSYTGRYYDSETAARNATPSGYTVRTITNSAYTASYLNTYGYGYYYGYDYNDPYYYYYYYGLGGLGGLGYTTTTKDTSKVTIGNLKGWTSVTRTINAAKAGASYTVNMKTETEIPESVLKALKGKNVTISFKFSNGAVFTVNGTDITSTTAISPTVRYGSTSIPSTLKKKAVKANSGVSSSQFTVSGGSFGASASLTVKFNTKRAGCSAKLYRYNASDNTLSLVSRSAVQSNGQCQFDNVKQGGEYIVVLS